MPSLEDAIRKASQRTKPSPVVVDIRSGAEAAPSSSLAPEIDLYCREEDNSPTSLFTVESIEQSALNGVQRLMNMWDNRMPDLERAFQAPEDYAGEANRLFEQYKGLRIKLDSTVAYSIGDTLNRCRERFFKAGTLDGVTWTEFVKTQCQFSFRLGYDFMNIASRLAALKGRPFSMDQFRAILQLTSSGFSVASLPENAESLSVKQILELASQAKKKEARAVPTVGRIVNWMGPLVGKVDSFAMELQTLVKQKADAGERVVLTARERNQLTGTKRKLESLLSVIGDLVDEAD